jgi:hypothetical protein
VAWVVAAVGLAVPAHASASLLIARATSHETLRVSASGAAQITWRAGGRVHTAVVAGGRVRWHRRVHGRAAAAHRQGIDVPDGIAEVSLPNGLHFALQRVRRTGQFGWRGPLELRFSRWRGASTRLSLRAEWVDHGRMPRVCGTATYHGRPFYGTASSLLGNPLDAYGRNVYLDVRHPGAGWYRIMGVLTHPDGFALLIREPLWRGASYRGYVPGPNVGGDLAPDAVATTPLPPRGTRHVCPFGVGAHTGG